MLAFFRRALSSWLAVGLLGLIMVAFIVTGVGTPGGGLTGGPASNAVATVGGRPILVRSIAERAQNALAQARQQQPALTMAQFLSAVGGIGPIVEQYIGATVLSVWGERHGLVASDRLVGGEIASIGAFKGTTGQFDEAVMRAVLASRKISLASLQDDIRSDLIRRQLLAPIVTGTRAPEALLRAYAQLVIDRREGVIGLVPASPAGIAAPTDGEIAGFYQSHLARYSLPERKALRYAPIGQETIVAPAPTEAEIAAQYKADAAKYTARETRAIRRVTLPDEGTARAFAAKLARGTSFAQAAVEAGLSASDVEPVTVDKTAFTGTDGAPLANAAFALPGSGTTAPIKTALGWAIAHVDTITRTPARSLDEARAEIAAALTKKKSGDLLASVVQQAEDALNNGASFNEVAAKHKLKTLTTPPLLPNGTAPSDPQFKADATITVLLKAAADVTPDDEPTVETVDQNGHFALLSVASVVPAAPVPLAEIKARVAQDIVAQRAADRARKTAQALLAKIKGGQAVAAAFGAAGIAAPQPITLSQMDLSRAGANVPAPVRTLFRLPPGTADLVQGPNGGWFLVKLERITPGDPKILPMVIGGTRNELQRTLGDEYSEQFANAARAEVTVKRNSAAIAGLEQELRGGGAGQ